MQQLIVHKLGPINHCELDIKKFMILTGPQASGKSTVAKCIFFFKNIKNLMYLQFRKQHLLRNMTENGSVVHISLTNRLLREIRSNFLQTFGTTWCMDRSMYLEYQYADGVSIKITLREAMETPNYIWVDFSNKISHFIASLDDAPSAADEFDLYGNSAPLRNRLDALFDDYEEIVYIPAGRSMITLLSTQINYIYSSMDDTQRKNLDYCTQNYLEHILQMKPAFSLSAEQQIANALRLTDRKIDRRLLVDAAALMKEILLGEYRDIDGEERLWVSPDRYVKINFASSGQQEVLWILNVLFNHLINGKKSCFIIEEPESHLFPNAQKLIAEFIALSSNRGANSVLITTHSPYILGTVNNLLYANKIAKAVDKAELARIIPENRWLQFDEFSAYYLEQGNLLPCLDTAFESIENEVIDGASSAINGDYERMLALTEKYMQIMASEAMHSASFKPNAEAP